MHGQINHGTCGLKHFLLGDGIYIYIYIYRSLCEGIDKLNLKGLAGENRRLDILSRLKIMHIYIKQKLMINKNIYI
jgi:hypothetical protein